MIVVGLAAQVPPPAATVTGVVVDARDGTPLRRARVTLTTSGRDSDPVFTDDDGRFVVEAASPPFSITVGKAGYTSGLATVSGAPSATPLRFTLVRSVAVTGRVIDRAGAPLWPVRVTARLLSAPAPGASPAPTQFSVPTDRLGAYRLRALPAGRYEVTAVHERVEVKEATPGSTRTVAIEPGDELRDLDFVIATAITGCDVRAAASTPRTGTAQINGRVVGPAGEPLACAQVTVTPDVVADVRTDAAGRYTLDGLPAGSYIVKAFMSAGYVPAAHGQRRPSDREAVVVLRDGDRRDNVDVTLPREATITGRVVDEHGEPIDRLQVSAFQLRRRSGRVVTASSGLSSESDDRGEYRLIVPPGTYLVGATATGVLSAGGGRAYVSTYHPGTTDLVLARPVDVGSGADVTGVDIVLNPVRTATVSGMVIDPDGEPFAGAVTLTTSARSGVVSLGSRSVRTDVNGRFTVRGVPPGDYVLKAPQPAGGSSLFGMQYVTVTGGDPPPVALRLSPGASLDGRMVFEMALGINKAGLELSYAPTEFDHEPPVRRSSFLREFETNTFRLTGVFGLSRLTLGRMPGCDTCYLKSVRVNGVDAAETPFDFGLGEAVYRDVEAVVSDAGATIHGRVTDQVDALTASMMVVLPAAEGRRYAGSRYVKLAFKQRDDSYEAAGLPPGEYLVAAFTQNDGGGINLDPGDPSLAELMATHGMRVTVLERERAIVNLRLLRR